MHKRKKHAIIIGAGAAGLTTAYYLLTGDLIKFGVAQVNGQDILIWLPTN